jgi:hypothetical protein
MRFTSVESYRNGLPEREVVTSKAPLVCVVAGNRTSGREKESAIFVRCYAQNRASESDLAFGKRDQSMIGAERFAGCGRRCKESLALPSTNTLQP